jgi:hypothetical protein
MKSIEQTIENELLKSTFDLGIDVAEADLDSFIDNPALASFPIIKYFVGGYKGYKAVQAIIQVKKLLTFLRTFHLGQLAPEKMTEFQEKFKSDAAYRGEVTEQIVTLNERFISAAKSRVLANLLLAHLNGKYSWKVFRYLGECLDAMPTVGFEILANSEKSEQPFHFSSHEPEKDGGGILFAAGICIVHGNHCSVNALGQYLYYYGIKGDINFTYPPPES